MKVDTILRDSRLNLPKLSELSGVDLGYLKQLSAGNASPGPETRAKLAAALRSHSLNLADLADRLAPTDATP